MSAIRAPYGGWTVSGHTGARDDWHTKRNAGTGMPGSVALISWVVAASAAFSPIGTGGDASTHLQRVASPPLQIVRSEKEDDEGVEPLRSSSEDIARVREVFSPAISDLATALNVSRQAIYKWINGSPVTEENAAKLRDLALAADVFAREGMEVNARLMKRKLADGKTLFQTVQAGNSAQQAAETLVRIHRREEHQRERMSARFASRKKSSATADFDLPAPNDNA